MAAVLVICLPWCVWAVLNLPVGSSGVHEWLPEGRPERARYEAFVESFGNDQVVLISWDGCRLDDPRLREFQEHLVRSDQFSSYIFTLESSDQLISQLIEAPLSLTPVQAEHRLRGVMLGTDGTAALLARTTSAGVSKQNDTIEMIQRAADETPGLSRQQLRLAGTVYEAFAVDAAAEASLKTLVLPSSILGMLIAWFCLGQIRRAAVVLILGGVGQLLAVAMVYYTGNRFSAVLIVLPTLVFMLTLSGAVHLMNYHTECLKRKCDYAGAQAMLLGWKPCTLSSITTMLGMGSLLTSQLAPVRQFGVFSAVGLGISTVVLLLGFPAFADWFCTPRRNSAIRDDLKKPIEQSIAQRIERSDSSNTWIGGYLRWMIRNANWVSTVGILVLLVTCVGLSRLKASTKFSDMFPAESKTNSDMAWIEEHLGPIATVEVLLKFPAESTLTTFDRARWVSKVSTGLLQERSVGGVFSAATFLPNWSNASSVGATAKRSVLRREIEKAIPHLESQGLVSTSRNAQTWRIMAKVSATSDEDYGQLTIAFGCMGWMNFDLDIAGILTASIALGIAVDDTLHFVCWYMDELRAGYSREAAVARTFHNCAAAMVHTTLISCVSMMPFLLADFIPTQQFAKLMIVMLSGAIVGDLVLLPALLLSPLGKVIKASSQTSDCPGVA